MKQELDKTYNPQKAETEIYEKWEKSGYFNPDNLEISEKARPYTIILPPPNITDKLHLGHAATIAIEDLLIRYHRLRSYRTLWLPGTDHAAIATQNVVERKILKEKGKTRHELGKEEFLKEVWGFLKNTQNTIIEQIKKMGASLDWSRLAFTLDEKRKLAVRTMFKKMYDEGVIYRGERIVNWCPRCHSTLADDEVEHKEQTAKLYTFKYSPDFPIAISTTRPETKLGDTAVAVNPKDKRYKEYIGKEFTINFVGQELKIKIVADRKVDSSFGTGALGVTPAHAMIDWQMAKENNLKIIKVINEEGRVRNGFGAYSKLEAGEAREAVLKAVKKEGLMEKEEDISNNLSVCYRCNTPIEPLPSKQWFIAVDKKIKRLGNKSLKELAIEAAEKDEIKFVPSRFKKRYLDWMNNLYDWCISRQIWFGHQIPVWYKEGKVRVELEEPKEPGWKQDTDTLDTWFSSGMWTFSSLGWPVTDEEGQEDWKKFHPTQVLETGYEIITLWVSRMIMMSYFALEEKPFSHVYLHGMILDEKGKKMSKSKGNGIDPVDMIEKFGSDATRLSLLSGFTPGNDVRFSEERIEAKKRFINKLWNVSRYILNNVAEESYQGPDNQSPNLEEASLADKWIIGELNKLIQSTTKHLEEYKFSLAAENLSSFTWDNLADWYLEIAKIEGSKDQVLIYVLKNLLKLWHPFIPFVTEKIWGSFNDSLLMVEKWPKEDQEQKTNNDLKKAEVIISKTIAIVQKIREVRAENKIEPKNKSDIVIYAHDSFVDIKDQEKLIKSLKTSTASIRIEKKGKKLDKAILTTVSGIDIYLLVEVDKEKEKKRLEKERTNLNKMIVQQEGKLANPDFVNKAPQKIVETEKKKLAKCKQELNKIENNLKQL